MTSQDQVHDEQNAFRTPSDKVDLKGLTDEELLDHLVNETAVLGARQNFALFRKPIDPKFIENWWTLEVASHLQQFYNDIIAGKRPKLAIMTPPQHGKSRAAEDFAAWVIGKMICGDMNDDHPTPNANFKTIFASYSDDLGVRINRNLQRMFRKLEYRQVFPLVITGLHGWVENSVLWTAPPPARECHRRGASGAKGLAVSIGLWPSRMFLHSVPLLFVRYLISLHSL